MDACRQSIFLSAPIIGSELFCSSSGSPHFSHFFFTLPSLVPLPFTTHRLTMCKSQASVHPCHRPDPSFGIVDQTVEKVRDYVSFFP